MSSVHTSGPDAISLAPKAAGGWARATLHGWLRTVGVVWLLVTLAYWASLTGLFDPSLRFDVAGTPGKVHLIVMATLAPVAAVGLWSTLSWGRVVWLLAIIAEGWFLLYGTAVLPFAQTVLWGHVGSVAIWLLLDGLAARSLSKD